ncbi:MAG TPA: hypothetical protein VKF38_14360 [Anaerolineaceae bacterium]|nr:hypothetical protein [Anaerolineaceae bacterium]
MKKKWISLAILFLLLGITFHNALAQNYSFNLSSSNVTFTVNKDGTASIEYSLIFKNDSVASPIDYVDIGVPNSNYEINSITADVGGSPTHDIQPSQYVKPGVAIGLGASQIPPGSTGTVHVLIGRVSNILHPATEQESEKYASFQFSPTWFDSSLVHGSTNMTVTLILPPGMNANQPRYFTPQNWPGSSTPTSSIDDQGRVVYTWNTPDANGSTQYIFGAAFPASLVPAAAITAAPINIDWGAILCWGIGLLVVVIFGFSIYGGIVGARRRKLAYLPPKITIEGHGIKRGLTAVEAAVLMEEPLDKVMTMILFSTIKKGAATVVTSNPLTLKVTDPIPAGLQPYEIDFLTAFQKPSLPEQKQALQDMMVKLVNSLSEKMRGFSRKETVAYYQDIIKQAWQQVEAANTPEVKSAKYDEVMDWTMADRDFSGHTQRAFGGMPIFVPIWWGRYDPTFRPASSAPSGSAPSANRGTGNVSLPTLPGATFAGAIVGGVQNFSSSVIGDLNSFTGGITNKTNPPPPPSTSTYHGGGGGHSCACACACAGCACACAGGGR